MDNLPTTPSFARTPRLPRMRSQRIVHVVQTEDNNDVSVVTISEDGCAEETQETVNFCTGSTGNKGEIEGPIDDGLDKQEEDEPIIFEVDLDDGNVQRLTKCDLDDHKQASESRRASLFSDDEFEPIRMKLPKRIPPPLRLSSHKASSSKFARSSPASPRTPPSAASSVSSRSGPLRSPNPSLKSGAPPTLYTSSHAQYTSGSSATLYSLPSAASSTTFVEQFSSSKSGGRTYCAYEKDGGSHKPVDIVTPDSVTGTRGLVDLRVYGYSFDWSRFAGRSEAAHGLQPEESAELEMFLSKGPNAFPSPTGPKRSPKRYAFEKRLLDIFKLVK